MQRRTIISGVLGLAVVACAAGVVEVPTEPPIVVEAAPEGSTGSQIVGVVHDKESGAPLDGALVVVECACLSGARETHSTSDGRFAFRDLPVGDYTVQVFAGRGQESRALSLQDGKQARLLVRISLVGDRRVLT